MNENPKNEADETGITGGLAARMLASELGESEVIWLRRLANWRKPGRRARIPWIEREAAHPQYRFEDVKAFIAAELANRPSLHSETTQEQLAKVVAVVDAAGLGAFVRIVWNAKTASGTFAVSLSEANELAASLQLAISKARKVNEERLVFTEAPSAAADNT